jgi:glycosyltransferase involved in cell wall biosynthesis
MSRGRTSSDLRVAVVCPAFMHFTKKKATSIDLFVQECVHFSRHRERTLVIGRPIDDPFEGITYRANAANPADERRFALGFVPHLREFAPDVIDVQQHVPTAGIIALAMPRTPVFVTRHNPTGPRQNPLRELVVRARYQLFDGIAFCSEWLRDDFCAHYPELRGRAHVLYNGIDVSRWSYRPQHKEKIVLCVGRMVRNKGLLEFARACSTVLPNHAGWRGVIVAGMSNTEHDYMTEVERAIDGSAGRVELHTGITHADVMSYYERAEIAVVPSIWEEPLGRTALEAHCAGAALVSSGIGGLREVSGDTALYLNRVDPDEIASALERLITDEALRKRMQEDGRRRIEDRFDVRSIAARFDAVHEGAALRGIRRIANIGRRASADQAARDAS